MKPTRHIPKLNKGLWTPKRNVWFKKNDDNNPINVQEPSYRQKKKFDKVMGIDKRDYGFKEEDFEKPRKRNRNTDLEIDRREEEIEERMPDSNIITDKNTRRPGPKKWNNITGEWA